MIAKALADPTRHQMLRELREAGEMTCSDVCQRFALSQPTISHHIRTLSEAGVITMRKEGPFHVLSVNEELMRAFAADLLPAAKVAKPRTTREHAGGAAAPAKGRKSKRTTSG